VDLKTFAASSTVQRLGRLNVTIATIMRPPDILKWTFERYSFAPFASSAARLS
jgi:hypothetical protein